MYRYSGLGFDALSLALSTVVQLVVSFNSGLQWWISQESPFFVSSQWSFWFVCFRWDTLIELRSYYANRNFYVFFFFFFFTSKGKRNATLALVVIIHQRLRRFSSNEKHVMQLGFICMHEKFQHVWTTKTTNFIIPILITLGFKSHKTVHNNV